MSSAGRLASIPRRLVVGGANPVDRRWRDRKAERGLDRDTNLRLGDGSWSQDRVVAIDTTTGSLAGTIPVGRIPWGIALSPDGRHLVAANRLGAPVTIIELATYSVRATIGVGAQPSAVAIGPIPSP
jgi:YVTN family beta-propeller protein